MPKKRIAMAMKISRMALWKIEQRYKKDGDYGLKDHKPGRLFEPLHPKFYNLVIKEWKKYKCGARKLHAILKSKGFSVSLRKISQVLVKEGFQKPCLKRRKPRKYKRYEWPLPNYMWHTDWHVIKAKIMKKAVNELKLRIKKGYTNIDVDSADKIAEKLLKKLKA